MPTVGLVAGGDAVVAAGGGVLGCEPGGVVLGGDFGGVGDFEPLWAVPAVSSAIVPRLQNKLTQIGRIEALRKRLQMQRVGRLIPAVNDKSARIFSGTSRTAERPCIGQVRR